MMWLYSFYLLFRLLSISSISTTIYGQPTIIYAQRGNTVELCDNRTTLIYAYEYRSFDGKTNFILEPSRHERYSNPYRTSILRITNVIESDSGQYKCPQDDIEWQQLQVYVPIQHVYMNNVHMSQRVHDAEVCNPLDGNCLSLVEGEPLDVFCAADGFPRPALDISFDRNGAIPAIMALATASPPPTIVHSHFKPNIYETYRILGLTSLDNGRNVTCRVDMKHIDNKLTLSTTRQLYIAFRPYVAEKSKKVYSGINQTRTINCTVLRSNPTFIRYSINGLSTSVLIRADDNQHDFHYTFDITPTSIEHFRPFSVTANNSIGSDTCTYEFLHGGIPDAITHCVVDTHSSNTTITIACTKSYAQGDSEGYACILYKYNDKPNKTIFEEIARTKSCIFALENFHEPVEFRVAAFNRFGSLPPNTDGYVIRLNEPIDQREAPLISKRVFVVIGCIFGGAILLFLLCCLCGASHRDQTKYSTKQDYYYKNKYLMTSNDNEVSKSRTDDPVSHLLPSATERHSNPNGVLYDTPEHLSNEKHLNTAPISTVVSAYQQKASQLNNIKSIDQDSTIGSLNSMHPRIGAVDNKFYGHPVIDTKFVPLTTLMQALNNHNDCSVEEEGNESPVYSTTTDAMSDSSLFLMPSLSSSKGVAPPPKPRYSALHSVGAPTENAYKFPLPLPKPRSRSNSRTRSNNPNSDSLSHLYEERPISSTDSGIGQTDAIAATNGDTKRSRQFDTQQINTQNPYSTRSVASQLATNRTLTSTSVHGTEC